MNENKALRFWKWAVILLVLCNIALISVVWFRPHMPFGKRPEQPRDFVIRKLGFSPDQVKKYDALISAHHATMEQLKKDAASYRQQLFSNLTANAPHTSSPDSMAQLIANNQRQIELVTYNHFAAVCTDQQKIEFDKIIGEVTKMMSGHGRGNRPPGDHQGPPPPGDHQGPPPPDGPPHHDPGPPENE